VAFLGLNTRTEHFAESSSLTELQVPVSDHLASKVQDCELDERVTACPPQLSTTPTVQLTTGPSVFAAAKSCREHEYPAAPVIPAPPPPRRKLSPNISHVSPPRASSAPFSAALSVPSALPSQPALAPKPAPPSQSSSHSHAPPSDFQPPPFPWNHSYAPPPPLPAPSRPIRSSLPSPRPSNASPEPLQIAAGALSKLSSAQRNLVFDDLLRRLETGPVSSRAAAAETLFNSTSDDEAARQRLSAMGVVRPLVHLLGHQDVKGQMYAAYTLSALTSMEMSRADMRECEAIPALLRLIGGSETNLASKKGAMRALCRLSRADDCALLMVHHGVLRTIVDVLCSPNPDATLLRRGLITLYFIGADKPEMQV
jgi:hypothetical protein